MSRQNLELARVFTEAWNRGDVDAVLELCHPEFEYHTSGDFLGVDPVYRGHEGFRKLERDFRGAWESLRVVVGELHDGDGLAVRTDAYGDWDQALEATGLGD